MCWGHLKRKQRGRPVDVPLEDPDPKRTFIEAMENYYSIDALDDAAYEKAWKRLQMAMRRYLAAIRKDRKAAAERVSTSN